MNSEFRSIPMWLVLSLLITGCASVGPVSIPRDRFDYSKAITTSWQEQTLLNLVKMRYFEAPLFLDVTSVINQYSITASARAGIGANVSVVGDDVATLEGGATYTDRPTVTYVPLSGQKFTQAILTPLPPESIIALITSGWRADFLLPLTVRSINGIENPPRYSYIDERESFDPTFFKVAAALQRIQSSQQLGMRLVKRESSTDMILIVSEPTSGPIADDVQFIQETLGLPPGQQSFELAYGVLPASPDEIAIQSRSIIEIILELGAWIDVPSEDVTRGRTEPTARPVSVGGEEYGALLKIHSSEKLPADSFAGVQHRGNWYWIDDGDLHSKRTFTVLMLLFSLGESSGQQTAPVVTVSAGQ